MVNLSIVFKGDSTPKAYQVDRYEFHTFLIVSLHFATGQIQYLNLDSIVSLTEEPAK